MTHGEIVITERNVPQELRQKQLRVIQRAGLTTEVDMDNCEDTMIKFARHKMTKGELMELPDMRWEYKEMIGDVYGALMSREER